MSATRSPRLTADPARMAAVADYRPWHGLRGHAGAAGQKGFRDGALAGPTAWLLVREAAGSQCAASTGSHQGLAG
jgi:hypothetical protein